MKTTKPKSLMKRLLTFTAVLGLAACGTGVANANDLFNPNLDLIAVGPQVNASPVGWQIIATRTLSNPSYPPGFPDGADSEPWCNVTPPSDPSGYGLFFKPFQGSTNANPALDDYLNVYFYQDNPSSANTKYTLSGYAASEANCCLNDPSPSGLTANAYFVVEFLDGSGNGIVTNYFDLVANGMPTSGTGGMKTPPNPMTTPQWTAPAGTVTVRAGAYLLNAWTTSGAQSFFVDSFDLESVAAPGSPVVTTQPNPATVSLGGNATFYVGTTPAATTYQWLHDGAIVTDGGEFSGSGTATLTITGVTTNDVGHYQAVVSNASGLNRSAIVPLAVTGINLFPTVSVTGTKGDSYRVDRSASPGGPWTTLTTVKLTTSPQFIVDYTLPVAPAEFYREVYVP